VQVATLTDVVEVAVSGSQLEAAACARTSTGAIYCWGSREFEIPPGSSSFVPAPALVTPLAQATSVSVGDSSVCVSTVNETVLCWGNAQRGALASGGADLSEVLVVPTPQLALHADIVDPKVATLSDRGG